MFSVGFSELILILIIAYVFVGPQDLPKVARWLGKVVKSARLLISELKRESGFEQLVNETKEIHRDINDTIRENADTVTKSLRSVHDEIDNAQKDFNISMNDAKKDIFTK